MQYGIRTEYWGEDWERDIEFYCKKARALGFDFVEIDSRRLLHMDATRLGQIRFLQKDIGVQIIGSIGLAQYNDISSTSSTIRKNGINYMRQSIYAAHRADIRILSGVIYSSWFYNISQAISKQESFAHSVTSMREIAEYAGCFGVKLMVEPVNRFATYLLNTAQEAKGYVQAVGKSNVTINLDTFHINIEEPSFYDAIVTAGQNLGLFHVCENNRQLPGQGHIPWAQVGQALSAIAYNGPIVIESFVRPSERIDGNKRVWRDLKAGLSPEQLDLELSRSLTFIQSTMDVDNRG